MIEKNASPKVRVLLLRLDGLKWLNTQARSADRAEWF